MSNIIKVEEPLLQEIIRLVQWLRRTNQDLHPQAEAYEVIKRIVLGPPPSQGMAIDPIHLLQEIIIAQQATANKS